MGRDGQELVLFKGACFEDLLPEFEVESDTLAACREQVVYQVELCIFEAKDLDLAQDGTQLLYACG